MVSGLLLLQGVALLGCPQLLDDGFDTVRIAPDAGPLGGIGLSGSGGAGSGDSGGSGGSSGSGFGGSDGNAGSPSAGSGSGGSAGAAAGSGGSGAAGSGGSGGSGAGTAGSGGTGGSSAGTGGSAGGGSAGSSGGNPACWTFDLTTNAADADSNCVGIDGWNEIAVDEANSDVSQSYEGGGVCFEGTIAGSGWGATYNFALAGAGTATDGDVWNAAAAGVTGFELTTSGDDLPPSFEVTYAINNGGTGYTDYCQDIGTGTALVPFSGALRENCSGANTGTLTDLTQLEFLRISFPVTSGNAYPVDFCLHIRAL
jgi:hypothetical protein